MANRKLDPPVRWRCTGLPRSDRAGGRKAAEREFTLKVLPLLKAKCFACHGDG